MEEKKKDEIVKLNEIFLDPNLSVEELEERLELAEAAPWICVGYVDCIGKCDSICSPVVQLD
ncbi:MAG: hypothetical protein JW995_15765 [Melioribacteraceae bacterium]|nr:hypothetical protein [Melioribacteraceae bacterium]